MKQYTVTEVLQPFSDFSMVKQDVLAKAAAKGTRVHTACSCIAENLFPPDLWPEDTGYVKSFTSWFTTHVYAVVAVEPEWIHEPYGLIGHPDFLFIMKEGGKKAIVDLKTPVTAQKTWAGQLCAYELLGSVNGHPDIEKLGSLRLDPNGGTAKMMWYEGESQKYLTGFLSALAALRTFK